MTTIRIVLSVVAIKDLQLEHLNLKMNFLHGDLKEDIYMTRPESFPIVGKDMVWKLNKILYGLKQAPRKWYLKFDSFKQRSRYHRGETDHCYYLKKFSSLYIILFYVDDMLIVVFDIQ